MESAGYDDPAIVPADDLIGDIQPQSGAAMFPCTGLIYPVDPFEQMAQILLGNPAARILNNYIHSAVIIPGNSQCHCASLCRVFIIVVHVALGSAIIEVRL